MNVLVKATVVFSFLLSSAPIALGQTTPTFSDVPDDYWAYPYIEEFAILGITSGCGGGNFCPDTPVTRDQMAVFMVRAVGNVRADIQTNASSIASVASDANAQIAALQAQVDALQDLVGDLVAAIQVQGQDVIIEGYNLHVRNGTNVTQSIDGTGNVIIGYNADASGILERFGSHNLILGDEQTYTESGQLLTQFVGSSRDMSVVVGGNLAESVFSDRTTNIGKESNLIVGSDFITAVGGNFTKLIGNELNIEVQKNMGLTIADGLALASGAGSIIMNNNGDIAMQGKMISLSASGDIRLKAQNIYQN